MHVEFATSPRQLVTTLDRIHSLFVVDYYGLSTWKLKQGSVAYGHRNSDCAPYSFSRITGAVEVSILV